MVPVRGSSLRVEVVARAGTVVEEVAAMLTDDLARPGVAARSSTTPWAADLLVLVGQGPEFADLELRGCAKPIVVLWELDPLPPPGLPQRIRTRRLRAADARERVVASGLGAMATRLPRRIRRATRRLVAGGEAIRAAGHATTQESAEAIAFRRLDWIRTNTAAGGVHHVLCTSRAAVEVLAEVGVPATRTRIGYHPQMGHDEGRARDLDVLFLGQVPTRPARAAKLAALEARLEPLGIEVTKATAVYGSPRASLLNRAKIVLNLRSNSWHPEMLRFVLAAACGALVVSEAPIADTDPFEPGRHFVATDLDEAPAVIERYVRSETDRRAITEAATELVTRQLTMRAVADRILALG